MRVMKDGFPLSGVEPEVSIWDTTRRSSMFAQGPDHLFRARTREINEEANFWGAILEFDQEEDEMKFFRDGMKFVSKILMSHLSLKVIHEMLNATGQMKFSLHSGDEDLIVT